MSDHQTKLREELIKKIGKQKGTALHKKYGSAFPLSYFEENSVAAAVEDICHLEKISTEELFHIDFSKEPEQIDHALHLKLYQFGDPIPLSDILPILENMGLRTLTERSYAVMLQNKVAWVSNFKVTHEKATLFAIEKVKGVFHDAFISIVHGRCENDALNKLVLDAELSCREIAILRAYIKYLLQTKFRFSKSYMEKTLTKYPEMTSHLIGLFRLMFDPKKQNHKKVLALETDIQNSLEAVSNLDEDFILRSLWITIKATLRTNYFQTQKNGNHKDYFSIKIKSREVPELPLPHPLYEVFVYSPRFEAIHLRSTKVSRGGIRWSDRREDFRTEILGLMKTQTVKNAIIVPSGAKGGFVLKALSPNATRAEVQTEVIACYQSFMRGLLDITDNLKNKKVIRPKEVICYDDEDPYLVVAADKGTATFSDMANAIAHEYQFWLGDAFASGGKTGYDHKKIGITARGAWESIKRHFRELEINILKTDFTVIGIGDMSGDVFGNGLLYTPHIKMIGAFDHRDIFIDPNPHPEIAFKERARLFKLASSSWQDYNKKLISKGGGVFSRKSKSIALTPEIKKALNITENSLTPNALICALLKAPVDLLFNGGIGTYVKASNESQADVGDKTNEFCRVNGEELNCRVVGEGGNLGFTQLGRIEYALKGGLINTDFIDNSGGVDCSDHEVNIKILLDQEIHKGRLTENKRNQLLVQMTDDIAGLVLNNNYNQAFVMSAVALHSAKNIGLFQDYLKELEVAAHMSRSVEFLPNDRRLIERKTAGQPLTRPELAVLLAYTKIYLKNEILKSDLPEDVYVKNIIATAFPTLLSKSFSKSLLEHPLHREIIATQLSSHLVNEMGITFIYRLQVETGATVPQIIRGYLMAANIFSSSQLQKLIAALDFKITVTMQYELLHHIRHLVNISTRWFLRSRYLNQDIQKTITHFADRVKILGDIFPTLISGDTKNYMDSLTEQFIQAGLDKNVVDQIARSRVLYMALNIIELSSQHQFDLVKTAKIYLLVGERFNFVWFRDQIGSDTRDGHWNTLARLTLRDELDIIQKRLTTAVMETEKKKQSGAHHLIEKWITRHRRALDRWEKILGLLHSSSNIDYTIFFIALRELSDLIYASEAI